MKNPSRRPQPHNRRTTVRAEIEHRRLLRLSRSLCTRHYFILH
ncbi:MAG: hypothetical protein P4L99_27105 [Chthoniobacter sp.]|nr:hypothetical protein [Chthoniobacter sp.]